VLGELVDEQRGARAKLLPRSAGPEDGWCGLSMGGAQWPKNDNGGFGSDRRSSTTKVCTWSNYGLKRSFLKWW
jgi:hypothetical protein